MSDTYIELISDAETGEQIERELTNEEVAELKEIQAQAEAADQKHEAKIAARNSALAKLADLGLTQEEIEAL